MFKKIMLAGCACAMMSFGGLGTVETADAATWRTPRANRIIRRSREVQRDYRQLRRQHNRLDRQWDRYRHNRYRSPYRGRYYNGYRGYRGYNRGYISTPYFSIGF
ncbi:hypothetical protein [Thalassoglobus polymorphus]|uniref:Uncharacterized protein n=1 Tax=Thalassoglobus polymorphus TaxID=2527994 RepID=A0A517QRY3_9PLAN|nr:hypothetical protein [Thalassoglobus polymorphus]QDT34375.1 hypothetical protein Mal48_36350 [Thalassoglobus polymorphus]